VKVEVNLALVGGNGMEVGHKVEKSVGKVSSRNSYGKA
jgi:hypothetical protein